MAGLTQITAEFMTVSPKVVDLAWGELKSALVKLRDADFSKPDAGAALRQKLVERYVAACKKAGLKLKPAEPLVLCAWITVMANGGSTRND